MFQFLDRLPTRRNMLITTCVFMVSYGLINFGPFGLTALQHQYPGATILDMMFNYTPDQAYQNLALLGPQGVQQYLALHVFDYLFPLTYAVFYFTALSLIGRSLLPAGSVFQQVRWLGLLAGLTDILENLLILPILLNYPARLDGLARAASVATLIKTPLSMLCLLMVLVGGLVVGVRALVNR
jgi:hypothetical protein